MIDLILNTDYRKINNKFLVKDLYAGIIYDKDGNVIDKILYRKIGNYGFNLFNDISYSFDMDCEYYIADSVLLDDDIKYFLKSSLLNIVQIYLVYKMFLNDDKFINRHLSYFNMQGVFIGYKGKKGVQKKYFKKLDEKTQKFYNLLKIIKCDQICNGKVKKYERYN